MTKRIRPQLALDVDALLITMRLNDRDAHVYDVANSVRSLWLRLALHPNVGVPMRCLIKVVLTESTAPPTRIKTAATACHTSRWTLERQAISLFDSTVSTLIKTLALLAVAVESGGVFTKISAVLKWDEHSFARHLGLASRDLEHPERIMWAVSIKALNLLSRCSAFANSNVFLLMQVALQRPRMQHWTSGGESTAPSNDPHIYNSPRQI